MKQGKYSWSINDQIDCESENIVYLIRCNKENFKLNKYVVESERTAKERISEHRGYINRNEKRHATGEHFNQPGHSLTNMKFTILDIVRSKDHLDTENKERHIISESLIYTTKVLIGAQEAPNSKLN